MKPDSRTLRPLRPGLRAATLMLSLSSAALAQQTPATPTPSPTPAEIPAQKPATITTPARSSTPSASTSVTAPDRSASYYHYGLAHMYEDMAVNAGRADYATQAIEEYKLALNADPTSATLQNGLADLYFRLGRIREAVSAAKDQTTKDPNDVQAHTLLGKVYLRSLGDMQSQQSGEMLQLAIAEYETLVRLKPNDIETHLLLGQLYNFNHDSSKAEAEFRTAQKIDPDSEEVVLNMARLFTEQGDLKRAAETLKAVPDDDRTARTEAALGATYDQLKQPKDAIAAYQAALDLDPENPIEIQRGLANALLADNQLDEALKLLQQIIAAEPQDAQSQIHIAEIERRQGHYDAALNTLEKAKPLVQDTLELNYNEALTYDALGRYNDAIAILNSTLAGTDHPDGKYSEQEKNVRSILLDRLAIIDREQNKTAEAVAAYKQVTALGGEYVLTGYQGQVDAYRDAHQWKEAADVAAAAAKALPNKHGVQLMYAGELADTGHAEEGIALAKAQFTAGADDTDTELSLADKRDTELKLANIYIRLKRWHEASEQLDKAAALSAKPDDKLYVDFLRGNLADRQKNYDEAEAWFRKALTLDPQNPTVLNYLGYMFAERGVHLSEAVSMVQRAVDLDPQNGAYLDSLGWAYFKSGQYALAEETLQKADHRISTDPTVHDHLGDVYEKTGKLKQAVSQWERSMTEYAHSLPADADPEDVSKVQHKLESARVKLARNTTAADHKEPK